MTMPKKKEMSTPMFLFLIFVLPVIVILLVIMSPLVYLFFTAIYIPSDKMILKDIRANQSIIEEYNIIEILDFTLTKEPYSDGVLRAEGELEFTCENENDDIVTTKRKVNIAYMLENNEYTFKSMHFEKEPEEISGDSDMIQDGIDDYKSEFEA